MAQNVYDDDAFFEGYAQLERSVAGLAGAAEWPTLQTMLPAVDSRAVLDLGCGYGWFCQWAAAAGARRVVGVDLSERMLERARQDSTASIEYLRADLEEIALPSGAFDLVYSSLTLHYVVALDRLVAEIAASLVPGGSFVFSVEHPIFMAPSDPRFVVDEAGRTVWQLDGYLSEGERVTNWFIPGVVKQHRTIETYLRTLRQAGLELSDLIEWGPSKEQIDRVPSWASERERPPFLLVSATRR
jgi:SAM-dependent methyltransferase